MHSSCLICFRIFKLNMSNQTRDSGQRLDNHGMLHTNCYLLVRYMLQRGRTTLDKCSSRGHIKRDLLCDNADSIEASASVQWVAHKRSPTSLDFISAGASVTTQNLLRHQLLATAVNLFDEIHVWEKPEMVSVNLFFLLLSEPLASLNLCSFLMWLPVASYNPDKHCNQNWHI